MAFLTAASLSEPGKIPSGVKRKPKYVTLVEPKLHLVKFNFKFALRKRLKQIAEIDDVLHAQSHELKDHQCKQ